MNSQPPSRIARLRRYLTIYAALWRNSVVREMSFKSNFILWIFVEILWFGLQLSFIGVIYLHTDHIASWTKWQVVMLVGASHVIQQIFQAFFLTNCTGLSDLIRTGRLDFMLLLPVNVRFLVSLRQVDLGGFVNATLGGTVIVYAAHQLHYVPNAMQVMGFALLCLAGIMIHYSLMFMLSTVAFWTVRAQGIIWGYYNLFNLARMPDEAFQGFFRAFFTFAIPILLVVNVPVRVLLNRLNSPAPMFLLLGAACLCFVVSELFWRFSIRHYTSASA
ncbi:MAG TPA: ABC-2 family transporter protein [Verrucomicrobiae bacterium]|jgi:ABC-2 type transport system permease protein